MFTNKRKADLPKAPDTEGIKSFSLFGKREKANAEPDAHTRRFRLGPDEDVTDVEVSDSFAFSDNDSKSSETSTVKDSYASTAEGVRPGLKILRKKPGKPLDTTMAEEPLPREEERHGDSASQGGYSDPLAEEGSSAPTENADKKTSRFHFGAKREEKAKRTESTGFFSRSKSASEKAEKAPEPKEESAGNPKKRWFFAKKSVKETSAETEGGKDGGGANFSKLSSLNKKQKEALRVEEKKNARRRETPKGSIDLLLELESNRRVYWRVSKTDVSEISADEIKRAVSFSKSEYRFGVDSELGYTASQDLALAEVGEDVRVINGTKNQKAVYASTAQRVASLLPLAIAPGGLLIDEAIKERREYGEEVVVVVLLKGDEGSKSLALLFHYTENNEVAATQITVNPDNLTFIVSQFAISRRVDVDTTKVIQLSNEELIAAYARAEYYPSEAVWRGVQVRKLVWGSALGAAAIAAACSVYAAKGFVSLKMQETRAATAAARLKTAEKALDKLITASIRDFSDRQSLNLDEITERAGAVWEPGAKVKVDAGLKGQRYTVALPLVAGALIEGRPSVLNQVKTHHLEPLLYGAAPAGCKKEIPEVSGGLNAVQINVLCQAATGPLSSYWLD